METPRYLDPGFWAAARPDAPGARWPESADDPAGLVWFRTSGTVGEPRWVGLSRESLLLSAAVVNRHLGVGERDVWGLALPLHHVGGFGVVARAFEAGARVAAFPGRWDAAAFAEWVGRERVSHLSLVPTQVHDLLTAGCRAPSALRTLVVGGGRLAEAAGRRARALGWPVLASFGMTEAGSQVATQRPDQLAAPYAADWLPLLPHWRARLDAAGALELKGGALFAATLERDGDGWAFKPRSGDWHATRDLAERDGDRLRVLGRADRRVKVLGELVDLGAIEEAFEPGRAAVVALPDVRRGQRLVLVCEGREIGIDAYNRSVSGPWRLDRAIAVAEFPRNPLGKIRLGELQKRLESAGS